MGIRQGGGGLLWAAAARDPERRGGWVGTHVGLRPVDEDLAHHPEQLLRAGVGLGQPVCPGQAGEGAGEG